MAAPVASYLRLRHVGESKPAGTNHENQTKIRRYITGTHPLIFPVVLSVGMFTSSLRDVFFSKASHTSWGNEVMWWGGLGLREVARWWRVMGHLFACIWGDVADEEAREALRQDSGGGRVRGRGRGGGGDIHCLQPGIARAHFFLNSQVSLNRMRIPPALAPPRRIHLQHSRVAAEGARSTSRRSRRPPPRRHHLWGIPWGWRGERCLTCDQRF